MNTNHEHIGQTPALMMIDRIVKRISMTPDEAFMDSFTRAYEHVKGCHMEDNINIMPQAIVIYGIGPVTMSPISQHQLQVLLAFHRRLFTKTVPIYCDDPCLDRDDWLVLEKLNIQKCTYPWCPQDRDVLLYMPHCERQVYNGIDNIFNPNGIVVYGNKPSMWTDRKCVVSRHVEYKRFDVFNDCCFMRFLPGE